MSGGSEGQPPESSDAPYGTEARRPEGPLIILAVVYGLWFLFLLWAAMFKSSG
jgi:hypothetical protein